jgi:protein-S-isoprenylcysteine O-methyltransferase Ste14
MANAYRVIAGPWLLWAACWMACAHSTKPSVQSEAAASRLTHLALLAAASALLVLPAFGIGLLGWQLLPDRLSTLVVGAILEALGLGWAVWARVHLGQYWSSTIDIKSQHQLILNGPYALVRHTISTGLVLVFLGTALAEDEINAWLALALVIVAYTRKIWIEEKWLLGQVGEEERAYQRQVKTLIPFLW